MFSREGLRWGQKRNCREQNSYPKCLHEGKASFLGVEIALSTVENYPLQSAERDITDVALGTCFSLYHFSGRHSVRTVGQSAVLVARLFGL